MDKSKLKEIIQQEIQKKALDFIKNRESYIKGEKKESDLEKSLEEEKIHNTIFFGGDDNLNIEFKKKLRESSDVEHNKVDGHPQISRAEIDEFEKKFMQVVYPGVKFKKNDKGKTDFKLYKGMSGIEASVSGVIPLQAENFIKFTYSIQDGPFMEVESEINSDVVEIISNLKNFYDQWKSDWFKKLGSL